MTDRILLCLGLALCCGMTMAQNEVIITDASLQSEEYIWTSDQIYRLDGLVYLEAGGKLTIEAGTEIVANTSPENGDPISALIIGVGAELHSLGNYLNPVTFNAFEELVFQPNPNDPTHWGGLILLGDHPVDGEETRRVLPFLDSTDQRNFYGGSGQSTAASTLRWTSVRGAGASVNGSRMAGVTFAGMGPQSLIDGVEVFSAAGDGFMFLGGSLNAKQLSASFCQGNAFSWSNGYTGSGQNWFAILDETSSGNALQGQGAGSKPVIFNATLIGPGPSASSATNLAIKLTEQSGLELKMSVLADFPGKGILIEDLEGESDSYNKLTNGELVIRSNIWTDFGSGNNFATSGGIISVDDSFEDPSATALVAHLQTKNVVGPGYLPYLSREPNRLLDPDAFSAELELPDTSSSTDEFILDSDGKCFGFGAFQSDGAWWLKHWTALDQQDFLMHPCLLSFFASSGLDFQAGDTVRMSCEQLNQLRLDEEYRCENDGCPFTNQNPTLVMRRRRSRSAIAASPPEFCYYQMVLFEGIESIFRPDPYDFLQNVIGMDTFEVEIVVEVVDTTGPQWRVDPCQECALGFDVQPIDCDSSWLEDQWQTDLGEGITRYNWRAIDRCGNNSLLMIDEDSTHPAQIFYQDGDGDGYGSDRATIMWRGDSLPGYVTEAGDCNDSDPAIHPNAAEDPFTNVDDNCDGQGNIEDCPLSDLLPIGTVCEPRQYTWNPSALESHSINECTPTLFPEEGDIWLRAIVPATGEFNIEYGSDVFILSIDVFTGSCDSLVPLQCSIFDEVISVQNVEEGDTVIIRLIAGNFSAGFLNICTFAEGITPTHDVLVHETLYLYPNPVHEILTIKQQNVSSKISSIELRSILGRTAIQLSSVDLLEEEPSIDVSDLSPGVYLISIRTDKGIIQKKLVKH